MGFFDIFIRHDSDSSNDDSEKYECEYEDECDGVEYIDEEDEEDNQPQKKTRVREDHSLEAPRRRGMNNDTRDDFVAIDFETMTSLRTSACALGMVKVLDGEIVQQYYTLINPIRDEYTDRQPNRLIHGISLEIAEKANTFEELFEGVKQFIGGHKIVCHNKGADISMLESLMEYYGLTGIDTSDVFCTYAATGKSLSECCKDYGIPETDHHNALWDAAACARIYLELIGKPLINLGGGGKFGGTRGSKGSTDINKAHRVRLDESQIENKDTIFFGKTVVITGTFDSYPERDSLAEKLQSLGAKVTSSISKKTNIVLVGQGAGPKKIEKIRELQEQGYDISIMREHQLNAELSRI